MSVFSEIFKGTLYNAISRYSSIIVNLVVTGILARILSPSDFGVVALTTVFMSFFELLGNMGFGPAIIQNKTLNNKDIASIFNFVILIAFLFAAICFFLAPAFSVFYDEEKLVIIMKILSFQLFFSILNVVPYSLLLKEKKFKYVAQVNVFCQFTFGFLAVASASLGLGIYSLLITPIGTVFVLFLLNTIKAKRIYGTYFLCVFSLVSIKKVLSFSLYQLLFNVVNYFSRNLDKLLIGNKFSMADLSFYEKSYRLMQLPISNISSVLSPTVQPVLSQYQDSRRELIKYELSILRALSFIGFMITPFLFFCSRDIIIIVFGDNWGKAIPIFQILSLSVFVQIIDSASGSLLQAANAPKALFLSGIICASLNVLCIILGVFLFRDLLMLSWLLNIAFLLNLLVDMYFIVMRILKSSIKELIAIFYQPFILGSLITLELYCFSYLCKENLFVHIIFSIVLTLITSILYIHLNKIYDILKVFKKYI